MWTQQVTWPCRALQEAPEPTQGKGCGGFGGVTSGMSREKPCWCLPPWPRSCIYTPVTWAVADLGTITGPTLLGYRGAASHVGEDTALPAALPAPAPAPCSAAQQGLGALGKEEAGEVETWHPLLSEISYPTTLLETSWVLGTGVAEGNDASKEKRSVWGILSVMANLLLLINIFATFLLLLHHSHCLPGGSLWLDFTVPAAPW